MVALNGSGRAPAAASIDWYESRQIARDRKHLGPCRDRAGRGQRVGDAAGGAWPQGAGRIAAAGDPVRRRGLAGASAGRLGLGAQRGEAAPGRIAARSCRTVPRPPPAIASPTRRWPKRCAPSRRHGARAFYEGPVAADMVRTLRERGGLHTEEDFAAGLAGAEFVDPVTLNWKGYDVYQCPPNGQGLLVLMMLGMLGGMPSAPDGAAGRDPGAPAYRGGAAGVSRPRCVPGRSGGCRCAGREAAERGVSGVAAGADQRRRGVARSAGGGQVVSAARTRTRCICAWSIADGNACSFINSLFQSFGSGILAQRSGVMLHNRGFGFRRGARPSQLHRAAQAADAHDHSGHGDEGRPRGDAVRRHGRALSAGRASAWFLTNFLEYGLDIQESIDLFRVFPYGGKVEVERGVPDAVVAPAGRHGTCAGSHRPAAWRRPGDLDRS